MLSMYGCRSLRATFGRSDTTIGTAGLPRVAPVFGPLVDLRGFKLLRLVLIVAAVDPAFGFAIIDDMPVTWCRMREVIAKLGLARLPSTT